MPQNKGVIEVGEAIAVPLLWGLTLSPDAAIGALFGAMFFWAMNPEVDLKKKLVLLLASFGAGYGLALPWGPGGWEMTAGMVGAALAHTVLDSFRTTIKDREAMPLWLTELLGSLPWRGGPKR